MFCKLCAQGIYFVSSLCQFYADVNEAVLHPVLLECFYWIWGVIHLNILKEWKKEFVCGTGPPWVTPSTNCFV